MVCIDFAVLFVGEFLKDWTTLTMMAILLVLLLTLRADRQKKHRLRYEQQMDSLVDQRMQRHLQTKPWEVKDGKWVEPS